MPTRKQHHARGVEPPVSGRKCRSLTLPKRTYGGAILLGPSVPGKCLRWVEATRE